MSQNCHWHRKLQVAGAVLGSSLDKGKPIPVGASRQGAGPLKTSWREGRSAMKRNRAVVHSRDGRILKGHISDFRANKAEFHLESLENEVTQLNVADLKAVFFAKDHEGDASRQDSYDDVIAGAGRRMKVTFSDGEEMIGYVSSYSPGRAGFFLVPADLGSNNEVVFVVASSCEDVEWIGHDPAGDPLLGRVDPMPRHRPKEPQKLRLAVGVGLLVLSLVPWIIAMIMPFLGSSPATVAASIGGLILTAEVIGAVAVVVLGHEAYGAIRGKLRRRSLGRSDGSHVPAPDRRA